MTSTERNGGITSTVMAAGTITAPHNTAVAIRRKSVMLAKRHRLR